MGPAYRGQALGGGSTGSDRGHIDSLKSRLSLSEIMEKDGYTFKRQARAQHCRCPFHEDRSPSFVVYRDNSFHCYGCGAHGDVLDYWRRTRGASFGETVRTLSLGADVPLTPPRPSPPARPSLARRWPELHRGSQEEIEVLAKLRGLDVEALKVADGVGWLRFGVWKREPAWFITDDSRLNLQARRMDGRLWPGRERQIKVQTMLGARASWPIGIREAHHYPAIMLVEGGPDLLAALHFHCLKMDLISSCPVAMLGASNQIPTDALPLFAEKRVRIYEHDDVAGSAAAERWAGQLVGVGCDVDCFSFRGELRADGEPVGDLNDAALMTRHLEGLLP